MELLRPLTKHKGSWAGVNWNQPDASGARDVLEGAVGFVIALLDPAPPTSSAQAETYDSRAKYLADELLGLPRRSYERLFFRRFGSGVCQSKKAGAAAVSSFGTA